MRTLPLIVLLAASLFLAAVRPLEAKVYHSVDKTYTADVTPIDLAVSGDGNYTFVLGPNGKVVIYSMKGEKEEITVGKEFDRISASATGDKIWLSSQKSKKVEAVFVDFIKTINTEGSPFLGEEKAPVIITAFSDFQCPHCAQLGEIFQKLLDKNPTTIKIVYKFFPLPNHQFAGAAAVAAWAAYQQGKFWQYHDLIYADFNNLTMEKLSQFAEKLGLNLPQFQQQMNSQEAKDKVIADLQDGRNANVAGTPAVFVNGRLARERTQEVLQKMIDEALKK